MHFLLAVVLVAASMVATPAFALSQQVVERLAFGEGDEQVAAIAALVSDGSEEAARVLRALADGELLTSGKRVLIVRANEAIDPVTGEKVAPIPETREDVSVNNRLRRELATALAALKLRDPDRSARLAAAKELAGGAEDAMLPLVSAALAKESDLEIKSILEMVRATLELHSADKDTRMSAIRTLGDSSSPSSKTLLLPLLEKNADGEYTEPDADIRLAAQQSLRAVERKLAIGEQIGRIFSGISLGSILLLAALGLAITYGLMGVINMAHGELIMIGAYTTYVTQDLFRSHLPQVFDWYLLCAVPASFIVSGLVGIALERSVIRYLYGRPLETLLATWGISLILMQTVRTLFGAQNVAVENPAWLSGGLEIMNNLVLPYSRIAIIFFAGLVLLLVWAVLTRTRLGLFVRGVTQNRAMASCVGVPTPRVDMLAFGLGSGIAGLAGCALSQIGNVGPDLGQSYIVDSFLVVVLGGVGQLAGTVYAGLGLGILNKYLEAWSGAVLAKIAILVIVIIFIQKRPQGIFALKGRVVEN